MIELTINYYHKECGAKAIPMGSNFFCTDCDLGIGPDEVYHRLEEQKIKPAPIPDPSCID